MHRFFSSFLLRSRSLGEISLACVDLFELEERVILCNSKNKCCSHEVCEECMRSKTPFFVHVLNSAASYRFIIYDQR